MASPTYTDLSLDTVQLSNFSLQIASSLEGYLAEKIFPVFKVGLKDGYYYTFDNSHQRIDDMERAPGSAANRVDYGMSKAAYGPLVDFETEKAVDDFMAMQSPFDMRAAAVKFVTNKMLRFKEDKLATMLADTAQVTQNTTLTSTQWSTASSSNPFTDIQTAITTVIKGCGERPNTIWMGQEVWDVMVNHPDLVDRVKYTYGNKANASMQISPEELGSLFGCNVVVGYKTKNSGDEGAADSLGYIWGKHFWVGYVNPSPGVMDVTAGLHFTLEGGQKVDSYRSDRERSDVIRIVDFFNPKIVSTGALYLIKNAVA